MGWVNPRTWIAGETPTAAMFNTNLRDNLNYLRSSATGFVAAGEFTASTTYVNLTTVGPSVTVTTDVQAIVFITVAMANNTLSNHALMAFDVSGATTIAASDQFGIDYNAYGANQAQRCGGSWLVTGLTAGSNTFTSKYRSDTTPSISTFTDRRIAVVPS